MKTMIIGLGPEYYYPGKLKDWSGVNNTKYASNHGASLISRALIKEFDGEHVSDLSNPELLSERYDRCIIAFATHITEKRDVSIYTNFVEALTIPVYAFSLGIQDYANDLTQVAKIHPSMKRLLGIVSDRSSYIGVRGPYTASILYREGFTSVLPIGCPTLYYNLRPEIFIKKEDVLEDIGWVYHRTLCEKLWHMMEGYQIIGQDFLDEVVFTDHLINDHKLIKLEMPKYIKLPHFQQVIEGIQRNGVFPADFKEWYDLIGSKKFVIGARLHGCIGALIQGVPAVMLARDLRVKEIAEFYKIPFYNYDQASKKTLAQIYDEADYTNFEETFQLRYRNYLSFLALNGLQHKLEIPEGFKPDYQFTVDDILTDKEIIYRGIQNMQLRQEDYQQKVSNNESAINSIKKLIKKIPFSDKIRSSLSKI